MESLRNAKKRSTLGQTDQANSTQKNGASAVDTDSRRTLCGMLRSTMVPAQQYNVSEIEFSKHFHSWRCGTLNIRSGKEKQEGAKMYSVTKEISKAGLSFCCLQEVRYRGSGEV